jgi:hypothetical protein
MFLFFLLKILAGQLFLRFQELSPVLDQQYVPILDQATKSIKISSLSAPIASMTNSGGTSMEADSTFRQPQISDNGEL